MFKLTVHNLYYTHPTREIAGQLIQHSTISLAWIRDWYDIILDSSIHQLITMLYYALCLCINHGQRCTSLPKAWRSPGWMIWSVVADIICCDVSFLCNLQWAIENLNNLPNSVKGSTIWGFYKLTNATRVRFHSFKLRKQALNVLILSFSS